VVIKVVIPAGLSGKRESTEKKKETKLFWGWATQKKKGLGGRGACIGVGFTERGSYRLWGRGCATKVGSYAPH